MINFVSSFPKSVLKTAENSKILNCKHFSKSQIVQQMLGQNVILPEAKLAWTGLTGES